MVKLDSEWGSSVAKRGFQNEEDIVEKFEDWEDDIEVEKWLKILDYKKEDIESLEVENLGNSVKPDIKLTISISGQKHTEGISIKRAKKNSNYNQVDKRWVEKYKEKWDMPEKVVKGLKMYTGRDGWKPEEIESDYKIPNLEEIRDERRLYFDELPKEFRESIVKFFLENKERIMNDIFRGDEPRADWMLVTRVYEEKDETLWTLRSMDNVIDIMSSLSKERRVKEIRDGFGVTDSKRYCNIKLGKITVQRKGGTPQPQKLQFKMKPFDLVDENPKQQKIAS